MIAEKAGVAAGTIYRYFESKDALIMELYRELEVKLTARLLEGYSTELSIREQFIHLGTALLRYFIEHPLQFRYIEQYHDSPYGVSLRRDRLMGKNDRGDVNLFKDLLEQGIARQMLKDVPLIVIFALAFAPLMFLTRDHILGFVNMDEALIKKTTEACWDAIKRL
jgi:AcrR family transcriptional regulator